MSEQYEVVITLKEVYDAQQEGSKVQQQILAKLDLLVASHDRVDERVTDHETRIRSLEQTRWPLPSVAIIVSIASLVWQLLK